MIDICLTWIGSFSLRSRIIYQCSVIPIVMVEQNYPRDTFSLLQISTCMPYMGMELNHYPPHPHYRQHLHILHHQYNYHRKGYHHHLCLVIPAIMLIKLIMTFRTLIMVMVLITIFIINIITNLTSIKIKSSIPII